MAANQINNRVHAMALVTGPVPAGESSPAYPNGVVMNAVGVQGYFRVDVGKYYLLLDTPIEWDVIPPQNQARPAFGRAMCIAQAVNFGVAGVSILPNAGLIPTDVPPVLAPNGKDARGSVYLEVRQIEVFAPDDVRLTYTDDFYVSIAVLGFPSDGASGDAGNWPAIVGKPFA